MSELFAHGVHHADGLLHDLRADAVAADQCDFIFHGFSSFRWFYLARPRFFSEFISPPAAMISSTKAGNGAL